MDLWRTELRDDGVFVAAYDNPPMNYFTGQATAELGELLARWRDPDVKAVVITGAPAGKYITHYSVEELVQGSANPEQLRRSFPENIAAWHTLLQNITYLDKAVVAGITGDAGGGGLELSLNCDIRILQRGDIRIGALEVVVDGHTVPLGGPKERALLALLAVHRGPCPQDRLIDDLWGDDPPPGARKTLQTYVWRLRNLLPAGAITSTAGGYQLHTTDESDLVRFEQLIGEAAGAANVGESWRAGELYRHTLELWRGEPFGGCASVDPLQARRTWLEELHSQAVEGHLDAELRLGHHNDLIGELEHHVKTAPLRERLWEMLALGLYRSGRQAEALRACRRARDRLVDELGISPSVALIELERRILAQDPTLSWTPPNSDKRTVDAAAGNLPFRLPRLIGREEELRSLVKEVVPGAAVTVVGPGGMGKTRLALQVAAEAGGEFRDGAWLVDLSGRGEPDDVVVALAEALGVPERAGMSLRAAVGESVRRRQLLVVLDNCDHLIEPAAEVVEELLAVAPGLSVLATSREPLGVSGERVRALGPLTAHDDGADDPAVELFVERAHEARADLDVTAAPTRAAVVEICAHLDGMPLAIELAAGRCLSLHPTEIAAPARGPTEAVDRRAADRRRPPPDVGGHDRLVLRPARRAAAGAVSPAGGVHRLLFPRRRPDGRFGWARRGRPAREPGGQVDGRRGRVPLPAVGNASGVRRPPSRRGRRTSRGGGRRGGPLFGLGRRRGHWAEGAGRTGLGGFVGG